MFSLAISLMLVVEKLRWEIHSVPSLSEEKGRELPWLRLPRVACFLLQAELKGGSINIKLMGN